jgi:protein transport protein SEC13
VSDTSYQISATLQGHEGPVWQVSWAHPKFGVILASCGFDGTVLIHRESRPGEWTLIHAARQIHESSINGIAFAPHEFGLLLAAASSDGRVSIIQHQPTTNVWSIEYLQDCPVGVNAVSWAPQGAYYDPTTNPDEAVDSPRIVTAGCDNHIRIWVCNDGVWSIESTTTGTTALICHTDWVRDVAWAPSLLPNHNMIASCSEDRTVLIWTQSSPGAEWVATLLHTFESPVWRVSWSVTGHLLAVSSGDSDVTLWKSSLDGKWTQVSSVEDTPTATES